MVFSDHSQCAGCHLPVALLKNELLKVILTRAARMTLSTLLVSNRSGAKILGVCTRRTRRLAGVCRRWGGGGVSFGDGIAVRLCAAKHRLVLSNLVLRFAPSLKFGPHKQFLMKYVHSFENL